MSTKTLRKRIALVAVSALGAGLLSVVAVPSASAATGVSTYDTAVTASATNFGIVSVTGTSNDVVEMLQSGQLQLTVDASHDDIVANNDTVKVRITQGSGLISYTTAGASTSATATIAADLQSVTWTGSAGANVGNVFVRPTGLGKMVIQVISGTTGGTVEAVSETFTVYVIASAAASASGTISLAESKFSRTATCVTDGSTTNVDSDTSNEANGGVAYISMILNDTYGAVNATAGALVATSSSKDAVVAIDGAPSATSTATAVGAELADGTSGDGACIGIAQASSNKPVTTTVTVTFNGTVIGSRTVTIVGQLAKLEVSNSAAAGLSVAPRGSSSGTHFYVTAFDAAGNRVATSGTPVVDTAGLTPVVSNITVSGALATSDSPGKSGFITCPSSTSSGSSDVRVSHVDALGATIYSNTFKAQCGGTSPFSVKASLDKASYQPGDVATLTLTATDSRGAVVADTTTTGAGYSVAGSNMTAVTAPSTADTFTWGTKTYKFIVGSNEGSYAMAVSLPAYAANGVTDQTVAYTIKSTSGAVSNADVLKAIVSLIASINKQIATLQRALLRR